MQDTLSPLVVISRAGGAPSRGTDKLCIFCHYDRDGLIADYIVAYLASLYQAHCDIYFVSNNEMLTEAQLAKIAPYAKHVMLRQNRGYDFAAYFTGYMHAAASGDLSRYSQIIFANDSVYAPFYALSSVFDRMASSSLDLWGITDSVLGSYHIQSYFWVFKNDVNVRQLLDSIASQFEIIEEKAQVVGRYEVGIGQRMLKEGFKIGVMCPSEQLIGFEIWKTDDPVIARLKNDMKKTVAYKNTLNKRIRALFSGKKQRSLALAGDLYAYCTGIYSGWYTLIRYFSCPFIKVSLLKNLSTYQYHQFLYAPLIKELYPDYNVNWIEDHLKRLRNLGIK